MAGALRTIWRALKPSAGWLPKNSGEWVQPNWLKLTNLGLTLLKLECQVLIRRLEVKCLCLQLRHLTVKSRKLLAQKIDVDLHDGCRAVLDNELLKQVQGCEVNVHNVCGAKWPN